MTVTISELENGWYNLPVTASHSDTLGILSMTFTNAGCKQVNMQFRVETALSADIMRKIKDTINVIELARTHHTHLSTGDIYYVDPVNGATHASGARGGIDDPYLTIQDCHDNAVTDSNHDMIILLPGAAAGVTTHTVAATTTISKRYVFIRGPGRDMIVTRTGSGDTLALTGEGVECSGFQIGTAASGSGNGITITGDFGLISHMWINDTQGEGILINQADNCIVEWTRFQDTGQGGSGDGLQISGTGTSSNNNVVRNNNNTIHGSSGYGLNIGAAATDTVLRKNTYGNNTSGDYTNSGTDTVFVT
jgi:hypothetical protein